MALQIENLGHSTFLVKIDDLTLLTDPFLTDSAGGIKRVLPPAKRPWELSPDLVLISHAHYDHLDLKTLKVLKGDFKVITPERCRRVIKGREVIELRDFETTYYKGLKITKIPVFHNRGRSLLYPDTGVGGFVVERDGLSILFGGDTAFSEGLYSLWARKFKVNFALLPIGGFMPFFRKFHQTPEEALRGFKILNADYLIPIHFGTWHVIPYFAKGERALERLLSYSFVCGLREKVVPISPGQSSYFDT
ncbi:MBL fold metallo-hydrolase [Thermovibrio sp.]